MKDENMNDRTKKELVDEFLEISDPPKFVLKECRTKLMRLSKATLLWKIADLKEGIQQ